MYNTVFANFIQRGFSVAIPAQAQNHHSKCHKQGSGIILLSPVILLLKVQNISPVPLHHCWRDSNCWSLVLAAGNTGWIFRLALHNRDPNKRAKKPHFRPPILRRQQCCNRKCQTLGNPDIRDQIHSKHRSETSSKIPCFKLYSSNDTHGCPSLYWRVHHQVWWSHSHKGLGELLPFYFCLILNCFLFTCYHEKQRTEKDSCLSVS